MATAKNKAAEAADYSMEEKITSLYELQRIDSKIDEINKIKGELPLEVQDLEDEIAGLRTRSANINVEIEELNALTRQRKREAEEANALIARYEEQQNNVRNNREFDALAKEIEYQKLEIDLANKRLKEYSAANKIKKAQAEEAESFAADRVLDLEAKRAELAGIEAETAKEIEGLMVHRAAAAQKIDERMLNAYDRIRANMHNGLAVVTVRRDACGGCYNRIPPQRQFDIRQNKKIIVCEYCGRILVSEPIAQQEK
jgi:predicted  nucleic acid-binding Zn-ribbon protein